MTRVDFYILQESRHDRLRLACHLAEKAYLSDMTVYVNAASPTQAMQLDKLLWVFRDGSFVPHRCLDRSGTTEKCAEAVVIGCGEDSREHHGMLINLASEVPEIFSRFERVAELVGRGAETRANGRQRFRFYRDRGYSLNTHRM